MINTPINETYELSLFSETKRQYRETNKMLLIFHIMFVIPELILSPRHMFVINIVSILFYLYGFKIIEKSKYNLVMYARLTLLEILLYTFLCIIIFGWQCGFQYWLFALISSFLKDYVAPERTRGKRDKSIHFLILMVAGIFIGAYLIHKYIDVPFTDYPSDIVATIMVIFNAVLAFTAVGAFTRIYTRQMEYKYLTLYHMADYDQLTGLGNRYYMNDLLMQEESISSENHRYSLAMVDIDHFKKVNDTYGHDNGDAVLCEVSKILSRNATDEIKVGRWGGEEFLIIGTHNISYIEFQKRLEKIRVEVEEHLFAIADTTIRCTISIGAAHYVEGCGIKCIMKDADTNLYIAKDSGRNKVIA